MHFFVTSPHLDHPTQARSSTLNPSLGLYRLHLESRTPSTYTLCIPCRSRPAPSVPAFSPSRPRPRALALACSSQRIHRYLCPFGSLCIRLSDPRPSTVDPRPSTLAARLPRSSRHQHPFPSLQRGLLTSCRRHAYSPFRFQYTSSRSASPDIPLRPPLRFELAHLGTAYSARPTTLTPSLHHLNALLWLSLASPELWHRTPAAVQASVYPRFLQTWISTRPLSPSRAPSVLAASSRIQPPVPRDHPTQRPALATMCSETLQT